MRKAGVPLGGIVQSLGLRRDISDGMVQEFLTWCKARPDGISHDDVLAAFPSVLPGAGECKSGDDAISNTGLILKSSSGKRFASLPLAAPAPTKNLQGFCPHRDRVETLGFQ